MRFQQILCNFTIWEILHRILISTTRKNESQILAELYRDSKIKKVLVY